MKGLAFGLDLLVPNWDNITNYYVQNDCNIDDVLWAYLDKHAEQEDLQEVSHISIRYLIILWVVTGLVLIPTSRYSQPSCVKWI